MKPVLLRTRRIQKRPGTKPNRTYISGLRYWKYWLGRGLFKTDNKYNFFNGSLQCRASCSNWQKQNLQTLALIKSDQWFIMWWGNRNCTSLLKG